MPHTQKLWASGRLLWHQDSLQNSGLSDGVCVSLLSHTLSGVSLNRKAWRWLGVGISQAVWGEVRHGQADWKSSPDKWCQEGPWGTQEAVHGEKGA